MALTGAAVAERFNIGRTPLLPLTGFSARGEVWLKAEYANPFGSVKDRTACYLLASAWREAGDKVHVVESTSGNLGIALAHLAGGLGVPLTLVMDTSLPARRMWEVRDAGATVDVVTCPKSGMTMRETRIAHACELGSRPGRMWLNQYSNEAGLLAHAETTGPEIWDDLDGRLDVVVASVGTGGTLCGIAAALRDRSPSPAAVGVEPTGSTISGGQHGDFLPAGSGMRGPSELVGRRRALIDYFTKVPDRVAATWATILSDRFGLRVGQTTGAAVAVARGLAERYGVRAVAIAADRGDAFRPAMRRLASSSGHSPDPIRIERFTVDLDRSSAFLGEI